MKILLIRHAETPINVNQLTHKTGDTVGLTKKGEKQAKNLIDICLKNNVECLFSSPEKRALETAEIINIGIKKEVKIVPNLAERNWGNWEGKSWSFIEEHLKKMTLDERYLFIPPKGESWEQMEGRLKKSIEFVKNCNHKTVAIITHEGALRGLMPILLNIPKEKSFDYHFDNGSVTIVDL